MLTLITLKEETYREETFVNLKCLFSQKISITISKIFSPEISIFNLQNLIPIKKELHDLLKMNLANVSIKVQ